MIKRYLYPEIERVFSRENKIKKWIQVEYQVLKAEEEFGIVPEGTSARIHPKIENLDIKEVIRLLDEYEKESDHEVVAFLMALETLIGQEARYLHYGLTSSDLLDTAGALILIEALELVLSELDLVIGALKVRAVENKYVPFMGRTHGVFAEPTSLGLKFLSHYSEFLRGRERLIKAMQEVSYGKISGAVGNYSFIPPEIEQTVLERLGLKPEPVSTQIVPRDRIAFLMSVYALIGEAVERLAQEIRLFQRTEVGEMMEPFYTKQRGSSAMPHKRNPIRSERLMGLARLLRGYMFPAHENIALWHERDISHSSVERFIIPDATEVIFYMLRLLRKNIEGLVINKERIKENMERFGKYYLSEPILLALIRKGIPRKDAYVWVKECAIKAESEKLPFEDVLKNHPKIKYYLEPEEIDKALNHNFLKHVDRIFKRFGL